jgi:phage head maturation protease
MTALRVSGLACPWNKYNVFDEIIKPGAFTAFLRDRTRLPMKFEHGPSCGYWDSFKETDRGLEVSGLITDHTYASLVKNTTEFRELSITYVEDERIRTPARLNSYGFLPLPSMIKVAEREGYKVQDQQTITRATLDEISVVSSGAFPGTYLTVD